MFRYVRWQGIAAFVVIGALVAGFWMLMVDGLVKSAIEALGTRVVGAKVELAGADVSFVPLGLELTGLQVTDPDKPMQNLFEFRRAAFGMDTGQLVKRRVIISEMSLEGVRTGTQRKTSGAIARGPGSTGGKGSAAGEGKEKAPGLMGSISLPDVKDILEKEDLQTLSLARDFQNDAKKKEEEFRKRIKELPDEQKIKAYQKRASEIEKLAKQGLPSALEAASKADALKKDIDRDLKNIKRTRRDLDKALSQYQDRIQDIKHAPSRDIARLKRKYAPSSSGAVNAGRLLLGPVMRGRLDRVLSFWDRYGATARKIKQSAEGEKRPPRGEGVNIRFPERVPMPDFLVRKALVTAEYRDSSFSGEVRNITFRQDVLGQPLTYDFSGKTLGWADSLGLNGAIDRTRPGSPVDTLEAHLKGYDTSSLKLSGGGTLPIDVRAGSADLDFSVKRATDSLEAGADAQVKGVRLTLDKERAKLGSLTGSVEKALSSITSATAQARVTGTPDKYTMTVTSDVDDKLKSAVTGFVREQVAQFEQKLSAGVRGAVDGQLSALDGQLGDLHVMDGDLDKMQSSLDEMLSQIKLI